MPDHSSHSSADEARHPSEAVDPPAPTLRTRLALAVLLVGTAAAYLWNLDRNGWANTYYATAVQAGVRSWKAFFFGSLDAGNFITVDKPPVSLWLMELSGRIFGFSSWSMLVPEALLGVASVALLYATVRRVWGPHAGLLAGVGLAVTPVAALMFRFNNPDAALTFLLVVAAWTLTRALERGRTTWLLATGAALGCAFLTKELQALLVLPGLALAYLIAGPPRLAKRIGQLVAAGGVLAVTGLWWPVLVDTIPAADRPYIGGSTANSVLQLALGFNGLGRLTGGSNNNGGGPGPFPGPFPGGGPGGGPAVLPGGGHGHGDGPGFGFGGATGLDRMFNEQFGGMSAWLIPAAVIGLLAGFWLTRRAPRTDARRASLVLWGGWFLVTIGVLSFAGGIIHSYYAVALAPALAAGAGMVLPALWRSRAQWWSGFVLAASSATTSATAFLLLGRATGWLPWLRWTVLVMGLVSAVALLLVGVRRVRAGAGEPEQAGGVRGHGSRPLARPLARRVPAVVAGIALSTGLAAPTAWSVATVNTTHAGGAPTAGPVQATFAGDGFARVGDGPPPGGGQFPGGARFPGDGGFPGGGQFPERGDDGQGADGGPGAPTAVPAELVSLLRDAGASYTWSSAAVSSMTAGPLSLASNTAVMSLGGFGGQDLAITLAQFKAAVEAHKVRYYVAGGFGHPGGGPGGGPGGDGFAGPRDGGTQAIASWVASTFPARAVGRYTVYDLEAATSVLSSSHQPQPTT